MNRRTRDHIPFDNYVVDCVAYGHSREQRQRHGWAETLVSSRLLEYEVWTRIHARRLESSHGDPVRQLIGRVALLRDGLNAQ